MAYNNYKNIQMVVELLKQHNIRQLIISPGGTNVPLVKLVQNDPFFKCFSVVDERSAAYFGIGIYLQTGERVGLICTSAQATRNYVPGLTEAYYKNVPLLAITMEKHPRFKYQGYMQAPDQTSLPNDSIKKSFELPYIRDINDVYHSHRLINEAMLELENDGKGPVQLCIPWLDFEIEDVDPGSKLIKRIKVSEIANYDLKNKKIMILIGEHRPFSNDEKEAINYFCENTNSVIYTNHLSNFDNKYSLNLNLVFSVMTEKAFDEVKPDILISIGGQTGDYPFYLMLSKTSFNNIEHWCVSEDGKIMDTYDKLTCVFKGEEKEFFAAVDKSPNNHEYYKIWEMKNKTMKRDLSIPFSNVSIAQYLHNRIPNDSIIQFSILNSLRVWNLFDLNETIECYSNVGAFGIDGGMSTLIGQSVVTEKLCFLVIGDLAFFYDLNSLGIRHIKNNLRIILINNNGGIEFKLHGEDKKTVDNYIAAADHFQNAKGWCETCGFKYIPINSMDEFKKYSNDFISESNESIVLEVFVSDINERDAYNALLDANRQISTKEKIKKTIKKCVGKENIKKIKNFIRLKKDD